MLICDPCIFFGDVFVQIQKNVSCVSLLSFENSVRILDKSFSSDMCFANIFMKSMAYLFILLSMSFAKQVFILMKSNSLIFLLVLLVSYLRNFCLAQSHKVFLLFFSSRNLIVLDFTFKSTICFELIFV